MKKGKNCSKGFEKQISKGAIIQKNKGRMKKYLLISFVFLFFVGCSNTTEVGLLSEISGVWRAGNDGTMVTINYDNNKIMFALSDNVIPVTLGAVDDVNKTINLNVNLSTGKSGIWTLRQVGNKEKGFYLTLTLHDGKQDMLTFVRKVSADDLNKFVASSSKKNIDTSAKESKQPQQPTEPQKKERSTVEQSGICQGLDLTIPSEQLECLDRKYASADKELNIIYKQKMASLDKSSKAALKKEQIA